MKRIQDFAFTLKCQVIASMITPMLPQTILADPVSHENGITLTRIQCIVYAILSWYEGKFTLRETIEILKWYLTDALVLQVIAAMSNDVEETLRGSQPSLN